MISAPVVARIREQVVPRRTRRIPSFEEIPEHVAAICYRVRGGEVEFLLVQSKAGRWTFPKGRVDDDASRAAAAAREAIEEAGAYGRVEFRPFIRYVHAKNPEWEGARDEHLVDAHLCEVVEMARPEESYRNPTWFSAERSKSRLQRKRHPAYGSELAKVVERAMERIRRRRS